MNTHKTHRKTPPTCAYLSTTPSPRLRCVPAVQLLPNCCCVSTVRNNRLTMSLSSPGVDGLPGVGRVDRRFRAFLDRPCRMPTPEHCATAQHSSSPSNSPAVNMAYRRKPSMRLQPRPPPITHSIRTPSPGVLPAKHKNVKVVKQVLIQKQK